MILFDFTEPEAKFSLLPVGSDPRLLLQGGSGLRWDAAAFRFNNSKKYRIGATDQKWHAQEGPRVFGVSVEARLSKPGRYLARTFPGGRVGNAFTIEFTLSLDGRGRTPDLLNPDWRSFLLTIHSLNQRMVFNVLDREPIVLNAGMDAKWTFANLDRLPAFNKKVGEIPASTRFDRLDTFEIG